MDTKTCTSCRTVNAGSAIACTNCGAVFGALEPATAPTAPASPASPAAPVGPLTAARQAAASGGAVPPMPIPPAGDISWSAPAVGGGSVALPARRGTSGFTLVVGALVALVVAAGVFYLLRGKAGLPDELAGLSRSTSPAAQELEDALSGIEIMGVSFDVAFYGSGVEPEVVLMVFDGLPDEVTSTPSEVFFQGFASGFATTSGGGTVDVGATEQRSVDGVDYLCAPVEGAGQAGTICIFRGDAVGMVVTQGTGDTAAAMAVAQEAHAAVA